MAYEIGDLVKFDRHGNDSHWAVYVGDDKVVHLTGDESDLLSSSSTSSIQIGGKHYQRASKREELIDHVANGDQHSCGNSKYDSKNKALHAREICKRARGNMPNDIKNCEQFAKWCRYDERKLTVGEIASKIIGVGVVTGLFVVAAGAASLLVLKTFFRPN